MNSSGPYLIETFRVNDIRLTERLDVYLNRHFPGTTRTSFQKQIAAGLILINGRQAGKAQRLKQGDKVEIFSPYKSKTGIVPNETVIPKIIYEDQYLLVLDKPAGLQVHPASGNYSNTLLNGLAAHLQKEGRQPHLIHRLDKFTAGLMVFAKNSGTREKLSNIFRKKDATRAYKALVWGTLPESGTIDIPIGRNKQESQTFRALGKHESGGKSAVTHYRVLQSYPFHSLVECRLETGRSHQIRVHFRAIGHPLIGDFEYGGNHILLGIKDNKYLNLMDKLLGLFPGQALQAFRLGFTHPETKHELNFELPLPDSFSRALEILDQTKSIPYWSE